MSETTGDKERSSYGINILAQTPFLQAYAQIMVAFPMPEGKSQADVSKSLNDAAVKLYALVPRLAGQVVNDHCTAEDSGTFYIVPYPPHTGASPVVVKDCASICPSWQEISDARGPMAMLPDGLSSKRSVPHSYMGTSEPQPVLLIQANYIDGGLLLTFSLHHQAGDGTGFRWILQHMASLMRGEDVAPALVSAANFDHADVHALLEEGEEPAPEARFFEVSPAIRQATNLTAGLSNAAQPEATWACFRISTAAMARLKREATEEGSVTPGEYISTDDALLAFLWKRLSVVRATEMAGDTITHCNRLVDMRNRTDKPLPHGYTGHAALLCSAEETLDHVQQMPLSQLAKLLRKELAKMNGHYLRTVASTMTGLRNKAGATLFPPPATRGSVLTMSTWVGLGVQQIEFGMLGRPVFARRAEKLPFPNTAYVMPRFENGDFDLQICLWTEQMDGLRKDEEWNASTEYIG